MPPVRYHLPPLADDADFDRLCRDLFRRHWPVEGDQLNGRSGQRQHGVDFYGHDPQGRWRGGQSKSRNSPTALLDETEVREEVRKALAFTPALHEYVIATSGPRDALLQQVAREITDAHRKRRSRRFSVKIYFWDDLLELLHQYPDVRAAYYGQLEGTQVFGLVEQLQRIIQSAAPGLLALGAGGASGSPDDAAEKVIADAAASTDRGRPDEAIVLLGRLRSERWESLGKPTRGRLLANLGFAHATQHDLDTATALYEAAAAEWPEGLQSRLWHLLALLERGPSEEAYALADALREQHPDHARVAALWVAAAPDDRPMAEIEATLPAPLRAHAEVALALGRRASRAGDLYAAERHSRAALTAAPGWEGARDQLGVVLLERAATNVRASGRIPTDGRLTESHQRDAREARELLGSVLAQLPPGTQAQARARIHLNLSTVESLLGDALAADRHIVAAWQLDPTEPTIAIRYARWCAEHDRRDAAIDALANLGTDESTLERTTLLAHFRIGRHASGDREAAETLLRESAQFLPTAPPSLRAAWIEIYLDLLGAAGRHEDARQLLGGSEGRLIATVARQVLAARVEQRAGDSAAATAAARAALAAVDEGTPSYDREGAALLAESFEWWADAIPLWLPLATAPGPATYHLLECARRAEEDQAILDICRALRDRGHWDPRCLDVEVTILVRYHDQDAALELLERAIPLAANEGQAGHFRVNLAVLARQLGRGDLADAQLPLLPPADAVDAGTGRAAVEALRLGPDPAAAVAYAYDLWRRFPEEVTAWEAILAASNLVDGEQPAIAYPVEVAAGTAVALREEGGSEPVTWIIEDGVAPRRANQELSPDDSLARQLLGRHVGEVVTVAEGLRLRRFRVAEIVPKAVQRWRWCMERWAELFPE